MKIRKILLSSLAIVAGAGFGIKNVYAAPIVVTDKLPDTITRGDITYTFTTGVTASGKTDGAFYNESSDGKYYLYCSDRNNGTFVEGDVLKKGEKLPYGVAYILGNSYPTKALVSGVSADGDSSTFPNTMANIWATQFAIWGYQGSFAQSELSGEQLQYVDNATRSHSYALKNSSGAIYSNAFFNANVLQLINKAKSLTDPSSNSSISLTKEVKWEKGDDVTKSSLISVNSTGGEISTFSLALEDAPEGTKVYQENGTEITSNLNSLKIGTKFYITVPNNKISSGEAKFKVSVNGTTKYLVAYKYSATNGHQPSVLAGYETKDLADSLELTITPDTASTISRAIYFLGFIILISGVGIIYANIKPSNKSEM